MNRTWRLLRPRHTIWPTRDGWWCLGAALGLGLAAVNTGNNLVYLLSATLLALIVVSGVLSEQSMRGVRLTGLVPEELHARRPALVGATVTNRKPWLPSYSLDLEVRHGARVERVLHLPRLAAGQAQVVTWETTLPARGWRRLPGVRLTTRFPFGLFVKSGPLLLDDEVLVYPALVPVAPETLRSTGAGGAVPTRRRGWGDDLHKLRDYLPGDDPRLIHWRVSARAGTLTLRELEMDTTLDTRIVLAGSGAGDPERLERGLSEAASLARHLLRAGAVVELAGPGVSVPAGRGPGQERRILTTLAGYAPPGAGPAAAPGASAGGSLRTGTRAPQVGAGGLRELTVRLD